MAKVRLRHAFRKCAFEAERNGFFRQMSRHFAAYVPRGKRLVVTFDNMKSREAPAPRYPWGWNFIKRHGWSHLGVCMTRRNDWFRHPELFDFFDMIREDRIFDHYEDVVFYGSSMGGYGALTYASAIPGARVVAFVPQTTLDRRIAPFETRYRQGFARGDWEDRRYADAVEGAQSAKSVTVFYDPYFAPDARHVARLPRHNLTALKLPFAGHRVPRLMLQMGVVQRASTAAIEGQLTGERFAHLIRKRRQNIGYVRILFDEALKRGHEDLVAAAVERAEADHGWQMPKYRRLSTLQKAA